MDRQLCYIEIESCEYLKIYLHTNIILYDTGYWENNKGDWIELNAQYLSSTYDVYGQTKNALSSPFVTFYLHIYSLVATCLTQV